MSYLLGCSDIEVERLRRQDEVWRDDTADFLDQLGLRAGQRVLELGCGIGLTLPALAERVGPDGQVVAIDSSASYVGYARREVRERGLANVDIIEGDIRAMSLPTGPFDAIFARWLFSFVPDVAGLLARLRVSLTAGGAIGILDYNHDGKRLYPPAPRFVQVNLAMENMYRESGGNPWVSCELPGALHASGYRCHSVCSYHKSGLPGSSVYQWIEMFADSQGPKLVEMGMLADSEWRAYLAERDQHRENPASIIFSPILVGIIGRPIFTERERTAP